MSTDESPDVRLRNPTRDGQEHPVVLIPGGVISPVAAKRDLRDTDGKTLIKQGDVYFQTLRSNGTPSTSKAQPNDWPAIMEICFENREADIGRFFRRHLAGDQLEKLFQTLTGLRVPSSPTLRDQALALLDEGNRRLETELASRALSSEENKIVNGLAWGVGLIWTHSRLPQFRTPISLTPFRPRIPDTVDAPCGKIRVTSMTEPQHRRL